MLQITTRVGETQIYSIHLFNFSFVSRMPSAFSVASVLKLLIFQRRETVAYIFSNSRRCRVCARLTGTSDAFLSAILSM
jgi:hypothetical protein